MSNKSDNHDKSRVQYISHKLYLEKRAGNRYYNLGYMIYKDLITTLPSNNVNDIANIKDAMKNFNIALLFNQNDIDAKARLDYFCNLYGPKSDNAWISEQVYKNILLDARKEFKECKC